MQNSTFVPPAKARRRRIDSWPKASFAKYGVFATTVIAFFLAETGDKTQIATVALAARYESMIAVVAGTTAGMMLANVPAVLFGGLRSGPECGAAFEAVDLGARRPVYPMGQTPARPRWIYF